VAASAVTVVISDDAVAEVEIHRPPVNLFDAELIGQLADAYAAIDENPAARAIVLCAEGKHFCAGARIAVSTAGTAGESAEQAMLYAQARRLLSARTPVVAAIQGAAIGGGLGLACSADFRLASPESRFAAPFARLGSHHGFGLTVTLPAIVGRQAALELLYTGRRIDGAEAARIGLADRLVPADALRSASREFAAEIAGSAPLALRAIRETMREGLAEAAGRAIREHRPSRFLGR
jgi:2-(1,2-epoxy-1,2-dihydrophenyl)acetyl-CoA isomerase